MNYYEKYINPFTDFGFKKIFGDPNAFERAEFIKLPKVEQNKYQKNLKVYRDLVNSLDTAFNQGIEKRGKGVSGEKAGKRGQRGKGVRGKRGQYPLSGKYL